MDREAELPARLGETMDEPLDREAELPSRLVAWYKSEGVDVRTLGELWPESRYVRVPQRYAGEVGAIASSLSREVGAPAEAVEWLRPLHFLRLPSRTRLKGAATFEGGRALGMDAASGAAALSLGVERGDRVLDLCCCPGAKLCCLADLAGEGGEVHGVDVSERRLAVARKVVDAHLLGAADAPRVKLFRGDGATFRGESDGALVFDSAAADGAAARGDRKRRNRSARAREGKRLKTLAAAAAAAPGASAPYDKVLVDADCSTDGSARHVEKMIRSGAVDDLFSAARTEATVALQRRLLRNGFDRLRPGGVLVYSTCSLAAAQNEDVVAAFLAEEPDAALVAAPLRAPAPPPWAPGGLPHTLRFSPAHGTSGLFVARLARKPTPARRAACLVS